MPLHDEPVVLRAQLAVSVSVVVLVAQVPVVLQVYVVTWRVRLPELVQAEPYEHAPHAPVTVVPHDWPEVLRAQPAVSVSVVVLVLQAPLPQVYVVTLRVREPEMEQVAA